MGEELGYSQSAISQMVNSLEEELSTKLILRSRKGITLTPDGEEFFPYIKNIYNSRINPRILDNYSLNLSFS
ncbi:LysR family transcriptional regulator [Neobacillus cucumis]|uniref:LysR family transcriptional regulator n=1 Tax=Neobacillus cucumis TaxID=1740721 RepID=UPI002040960C|nr:LysR family transcriptional regulator [Neobacillus cucumis]MCM3728452.1 LysR family transcriptional regulator [Neobacillus cucumis]